MYKSQPKKKSEMAGPGCLVQAIGLLMPFVGWYFASMIGAIIGGAIMLAMLLVGSRMALKWICPECNNPVASKNVRICPACQARFE